MTDAKRRMEIPKGNSKGLKIMNSWGKNKMPFVPIDPKGERVTVYVCGPTVYDSAHLGHARAYLTFDIILRILSDYFGYNLYYVMNITDVDDKIILRARQNHLFAKYAAAVTDPAAIVEDMKKAYPAARKKHEDKIAGLEAKLAGLEAKEAKETKEIVQDEKLKLQNVIDAEAKAFAYLDENKGKPPQEVLAGLLPLVKPEISKMLDKKSGAGVTDLSIFRKHAAKYEQEFLEDLRSLGVRMPSVLTRVSEYIPEIIQFVEELVKKGVAYESNGSVYFDVSQFRKTHAYCKLRPECAANTDLAEEGEGALGSNTGDKKNQSDFALWKKSKPGDPRWDSPWGAGRPGWHIECSAMSGELLGGNFDIHGGGVDLQFPHHDNEIAQSEAFFGCHQWVNYWMHAGHLHVKGRKMSKSLKNFTTIRASLESHTPLQLRLMFLLSKWDSMMNFDENSLQEVYTREKSIRSFFKDAHVAMRSRKPESQVTQKWNETDEKLNQFLLSTKTKVHDALCDNLNWPTAMNSLSALITQGQKYLRLAGFKTLLLQQVLAYTTRMLKIFGVIPADQVGFQGGQEGAVGASREELAGPFIEAVTGFRDQLRAALRSAGKGEIDKKTLFAMCDALRDEVMPKLGVRVTDNGAAESKWSLEDPAVLAKEAEERQAAEAERRAVAAQRKASKRKAAIERARTELKQFEDYKTDPAAYFQTVYEKRARFTAFDEKTGFPTTERDEQGNEIPLAKGTIKGLKKVLAKYTKIYSKCAKKISKDADYVTKLQATLQKLLAEDAAAAKSK